MWLGLHFVSAAVVAAGVLADTAQALPVTVAEAAVARAGGDVHATASEAAVGCRRGQGDCRARPGAPSRGFYAPSDYYVRDANKLPFGSERWRDQMRRENRLGNPG